MASTSVDKKVAKAKDELETERRKNFVEAIQTVEKEHGYKVVAMMNYNHRGIFAELGIDKQEKESVA